MNEGLPYEEELARQLNNVPLPDENSAWEDMKRRLEKDDDDPIIITPVSKGCLSYSLLLVGLLVALFFIITHEKRQLHRKEEDNVNSKKQNVR
ncbi:MAG: hypothetical protein ABJA32_09475, partial [Ginsengibacter sp.]